MRIILGLGCVLTGIAACVVMFAAPLTYGTLSLFGFGVVAALLGFEIMSSNQQE